MIPANRPGGMSASVWPAASNSRVPLPEGGTVVSRRIRPGMRCASASIFPRAAAAMPLRLRRLIEAVWSVTSSAMSGRKRWSSCCSTGPDSVRRMRPKVSARSEVPRARRQMAGARAATQIAASAISIAGGRIGANFSAFICLTRAARRTPAARRSPSPRRRPRNWRR